MIKSKAAETFSLTLVIKHTRSYIWHNATSFTFCVSPTQPASMFFKLCNTDFLLNFVVSNLKRP